MVLNLDRLRVAEVQIPALDVGDAPDQASSNLTV
jgi:hypothetical protein